MIIAIIYVISGILSTFLCLCCMKSNREREKLPMHCSGGNSTKKGVRL